MADYESTISPHFGEMALKLGLCHPTEIAEALALQEEQWSCGRRPARLGQILIGQGVLTLKDVRRIMGEVEHRTKTLSIPGCRSLEIVSRDARTLTFRGMDQESSRQLLIQILRFSLAEDEEIKTRFLEAGRALEDLDHPGIVKVIGVGRKEGIPYLIRERVPAPSLAAVLEDGESFPEERALQIARDVAEAVGHAHGAGLIHGALRPTAILVSPGDRARVTGFSPLPGLDAPGISSSDVAVYSAPEQLRESGVPGPLSDVYSLGAVLYHMLTGRPPFRGSRIEVAKQHARRRPPDPRVLAPSTSLRAAVLIASMMEKVPERRPDGMAAVVRAIDRLPDEDPTGEPLPGRVTAGGGRLGRLRSRRSR